MAVAKEKARADLLEITAPIRSKVLSYLKSSIKAGILADPDMWKWVRRIGGAILDNILDDVEQEIERNIQTAVLRRQEDADTPGPEGNTLSCCWYKLRAFVLYHYLPHDKCLFGKLKDPVYVFMYLITLVPVHGLRIAMFAVILLFLTFPGPPDEFQLINFILLCKGMQFLTSGIIQMAAGASKYFICYSFSKEELLSCMDNRGPGANDGVGLALDYLGSASLVWLAWFLLARSKKHGQDKNHNETLEEAARRKEAGGRLRSLLMYDMKCFCVSLFILLCLTIVTCAADFADGGFRAVLYAGQLQANIFWCCVGYSLTSLPFAPFTVPGLQEVMTHCYATGFNRNGACVSFDTPSQETAAEDSGGSSMGSYFNMFATGATELLKAAHRGRALRGGDPEEEYKFSDVRRGLYAQLPSAKTFFRGAFGGGAAPVQRLNSRKRVSCLEEPNSGLSGLLAVDEEPLCVRQVSAVLLPPEGVEERDGTAWFRLLVLPEASLDAESGTEGWQISRRYSDFEALRKHLGRRASAWTEAPFPPKTWRTCAGEQLEQRRAALERWLARCLQEWRSQEGWERLLHDFLTLEACYEEPQGLVGGLAQRLWARDGAKSMAEEEEVEEAKEEPKGPMMSLEDFLGDEGGSPAVAEEGGLASPPERKETP